MNIQDYMRGSVKIAPMALLALSCNAVWADTFDSNPFIDTTGGGFVYVDVKENVVEPGIKAVTFTATRDDSSTNDNPVILEPYDKFTTDFSDLDSRGIVTNCLMASNEAYCDSISGSGKRIKVYLTDQSPTDIRLSTTSNDPAYPDVDTSSVDYFTFGKMSNFTGARMTGFNLELLDADGNLMDESDPDNAVLFNLAATEIGLGAGMTDGLFGDGGQENNVGFFSDDKTKFNLVTTSGNVLTFDGLSNDDYNTLFGDGYLDNTMVPDGIFWDDNEDPDDEGALIAWNNPSQGGWTYGALDTEDNIDARLSELATSLGVSVDALNYESGSLVPDDIVAAATANGLFEVEPVEDLRNANLNYTMTVGTIEGGEVTVRLRPKFADIVEGARTDSQLRNAIYLDTVAEVPFLNLSDNTDAYQTAIASLIEQGDDADLSIALDSIGFGYAPAFTSLGFETSRDQIEAITRYVPWSSTNDNQDSNLDGTSWMMQNGLYGFASQSGSRSEYDPVTNALGYDVDVYSLSAGVEKRFNGTNSSVGVAVGYTDATAETDQGLGEIDADGYSVSAFTRTRFGNGGLVQALVGYQDLSYESGRTTFDQGSANADVDGTQKFAALSVDYLKDMGKFKVGPTASVEYYDISTDGFVENGADIWNLDVKEQSSDIILASIGARGEYAMNNNTRLTSSVKYTNISGDDLNIQSGLVGQADAPSYTVEGMSEDLVDVSIGVDRVVLSNASSQVAIYGGYRGSFGDDYDSQGLQIGVNTTF